MNYSINQHYHLVSLSQYLGKTGSFGGLPKPLLAKRPRMSGGLCGVLEAPHARQTPAYERRPLWRPRGTTRSPNARV